MTDAKVIERSLEQDRQDLVQSLVALRGRLRPAALAAEGKQAIVTQTQPLLDQMNESLRASPVLSAVAGLIFGKTRLNGKEPQVVPVMADTKYEALTRWEGEGGLPTPHPVDPDEGWLSEVTGLRKRAIALLETIDSAARAGRAPAADLAQNRAQVVRALVDDTRKALAKGLESLTEADRERVLRAREQRFLDRLSAAGKDRLDTDTHPFAIGILCAVGGAALGYILPGTDIEDRWMGQVKDRVLYDLKAILRDEAATVGDIARLLSVALKGAFSPAARRALPVRAG